MIETRLFESEDELQVLGWPDAVGFTVAPTMPALIDRGCGALTTVGRYQFDGNLWPRFRCRDDGCTYPLRYLSLCLGECPACHGLPASHHDHE